MSTHPLGPSVELPGGHETCEGYAEMGGATPCQRTHWGLWWSSLGATKRVRGVPKLTSIRGGPSGPRTTEKNTTASYSCHPNKTPLRWASQEPAQVATVAQIAAPQGTASYSFHLTFPSRFLRPLRHLLPLLLSLLPPRTLPRSRISRFRSPGALSGPQERQETTTKDETDPGEGVGTSRDRGLQEKHNGEL